MKVIFGATLAAVVAQTACAQGYSEHHAVRAFTEKPCGYVLAILDSDDATLPSFGGALSDVGTFAVTTGFILGFDHANGGLWKGDVSTLQQFRSACESDPLLTGAEILHDLAAD
jgi:hypothetical protein